MYSISNLCFSLIVAMAAATPVYQNSSQQGVADDKETSPYISWTTLPVDATYKCHRLQDNVKDAAGVTEKTKAALQDSINEAGSQHHKRNWFDDVLLIISPKEPLVIPLIPGLLT